MKSLMEKIPAALRRFLKDPLFLRRWEEEWYHHQGQQTNQISLRIMPVGRGTYAFNATSHMFIEDMYLGIMPFLIYSGEREKYPATTEPRSPLKERMVAEGISSRGYNQFLGDALCDFVRNAMHTIFQRGLAIYEIVYEKDAHGETMSFDLQWMQSSYLFKLFGNYYQVIPWWVARRSHLRVQILKIPAEKILRIELPRQYGGKRGLQRILRRLRALGEQLIPKFQMKALENNEQINFDFKAFTRAKYLETAHLTSGFGWNQRQLSGDNITEYYSMIRYLRQQRMEAEMRHLIISTLNDALNRAPLSLGVQVSIANLPGLVQIRQQEEAIRSGSVKFIDIYNAVKI